MAHSEVCQDVEKAVIRPLWEPQHEWESRVKFVEDYITDYGLEKAINLSLVWANMNFLQCRYPPEAEALVANYSVPSLDELRARRKRKRSALQDQDSVKPSSYKIPKTIFPEVSALLSTVRTKSTIDSTPLQLQTIANKMCLCKDCLSLMGNEDYLNMGMKILERYKTMQKEFTYELTHDEAGDQQNELWSLVINHEIVLKRNGSKTLVLEELIKILNNWQEANQKPACPLVTASSTKRNPGYDHFRSNSGEYQSHSHSNYGGNGSACEQKDTRSYHYRDWGSRKGRGYGQDHYY